MQSNLIVAGPTCPECGGKTELFIYPHANAGMWQCLNLDCGAMDACEHPDTIHEVVEVDTMRNGEHDTYETTVEVCLDCKVQVEA